MIMRKRAGRLALCLAATAALSASRGWADTTSVLVQTGVTTAPGAGGGTISTLPEMPAINSSGQMSFLSNLVGSADGANKAFIRVEPNGSLTPLMRTLEAAPGAGGGTFNNF